MNYTHKKIAAALLSLLIIGGTAPVLGRADVFRPVVASAIDNNVITYDETTHVLTLRGEFDNYTLEKYKDKGVKTIVAEEGAALVEYAAYLFSGFKDVEKIDLTNLDGSRAKYVYSMFENCESLKEVKLCPLTNAQITDASCMFYKCSSLVSVDLSGLNTSSVTNFRNMFYGCTALKEAKVSGFDISKGTDFNSMFNGCANLNYLDLSSWDLKRAQYTDYMFYDCRALAFLKLSDLPAPELTSAGSMFYNCNSLRTLDLSGFNTPKLINASFMFTRCTALENIDVSGMDTSNVTDMSSMFAGCEKLKKIDLSNFNTSNVRLMPNMFAYCTALEDLDISSFDTSKVEHTQWMFYGDASLNYIDFSQFNFDKVSYADKMFDGSDTLAPYISTINGGSISLDGDIGVNYYVTLGSSASKAVLSGPKGDIVINDFAPYKRENGSYKFSYPVNAVQMSDKVNISFYDNDGRQLILLKSNDRPASYATGSFSVSDYIFEAVRSEDGKLADLAKALDNYGKAAENHFLGSTNEVYFYGVDKDTLETYKPTFGTDIAVSLVLGSETSLRFYTLSDNVRIDDAKATAKTSQFGRYYEIKNIPAHELLKPHKLTVGGNDYTVTPMAYVYRVLDNSASSNNLKDVAKAVYVYAKAAETYMNAQ